MWCRLDGAKCFAKPASKKSNRGRTCSCCKVKKSACSFNKGTTSSLAVSSNEISEVLQNLVATMTILAGKVDSLTGEVASLWSRVGDLCHDYCTEDLESPSDFLSDSEPEGWKALCAELHDLERVNSKALQWVMGFWLDHDVTQLRKVGLLEPEKVDPQDLYEIANCQFWYGTSSPEMIEIMKVQCALFQAMRNEFYKLGGCRSKWQFWKDHLCKHCEDFMVEDSDPEEKVLDGKVRKVRKPYRDNLGIPALDGLFVLETDPAAMDTSGEDEGEESGDSQGSESAEDEGKVPAGEEDVEMVDAASVVDGSSA